LRRQARLSLSGARQHHLPGRPRAHLPLRRRRRQARLAFAQDPGTPRGRGDRPTLQGARRSGARRRRARLRAPPGPEASETRSSAIPKPWRRTFAGAWSDARPPRKNTA
jgi:hypothetical protein